MRKTPELNPDNFKTLQTDFCKQKSVRLTFGLQCPTSPLIPPRKVPLEDLIYTSCTDPIPQPAAPRTPILHQPSAVTHLFYAYAYVRKATNTEFNLVVLGRDLICILGFDSLAKQLRTSLKICE
ncbi:pentatricopeptide repeat-containing protein chloroplastic [Dorcoceras hygrometricum]|uniref:Pentatricopeptide repeat-containing protein chloroplastic n=1 Tax=Dorcoceras hygrometricum TaxID=472368 RepID=A0A2Z7C8P0_9LAMI|nr:pentatricopeptide repeat-containing protein chloroplastic [Dorcoceras hygrometricum]